LPELHQGSTDVLSWSPDGALAVCPGLHGDGQWRKGPLACLSLEQAQHVRLNQELQQLTVFWMTSNHLTIWAGWPISITDLGAFSDTETVAIFCKCSLQWLVVARIAFLLLTFGLLSSGGWKLHAYDANFDIWFVVLCCPYAYADCCLCMIAQLNFSIHTNYCTINM
jgi:hypothetical protein